MTAKPGTVFGAILLCLSAAFGLAALGLTFVDSFARFALGRPFSFEEVAEFLVAGAVMFGAAAALYVFRDPAAPRGPRWLGWPGAGIVSLAAAAALGLAVYALREHLAFVMRAGETTMLWKLPNWFATALALAGCAAIAGFAIANTALAPLRFPVLPLAPALLFLGVLVGLIAVRFGLVERFLAEAFRQFDHVLLAVLAAGSIAGAIATLKSRARIAPLAAPAVPVVLAGAVAQISIGDMLAGGIAVFLLMAIAHALLGLARGFRAAADDLIGLGVLALSVPLIAIGVFTPSEMWAVLAVPGLIVLVTIALILRRDAIGSALAQGWSHGIGAVFVLVPVVVLSWAGTLLGVPSWIMEALAPVLESAPATGLLLIATTTLLAAVLGMPAGITLALVLLMPGAIKAGAAPTILGLAAALAGMAGGSLFGWLAPRLARAAPEDCTPVPAREAVLGAVPPFVAALLVWFVPDLLMRFD